MKRLKLAAGLPILVYSDIESERLPTFKKIPYDSYIDREWYDRMEKEAPELVKGLFTRGDPPLNCAYPMGDSGNAGDSGEEGDEEVGPGAGASVGAGAGARADDDSADKSSDGELYNSDNQTKRKAHLSLAEDDMYARDKAPGSGDDGGAFGEEDLAEMRQDPHANNLPASP